MIRKVTLTIIAVVAACTTVSAQKYKYIDKTVAVVGNEAIMISDIEASVKERGAQGMSSDQNVRCEVLENINDFSLENQEKIVHEWIEKNELKLGNVMNAWRLCLVGEGKGPGMFDISAFLGKEETIRRTRKAIEVLG